MMHILQKDYIVANICAYAIAIASSFFWNKTWVFKSQEKSWHKELLLYLAAFGCAYSLQFTFLYSMVEFLNMNKYLAQFLGLFIFGATNFIFNKLLTFRKR